MGRKLIIKNDAKAKLRSQKINLPFYFDETLPKLKKMVTKKDLKREQEKKVVS